MGCTQSDVVRHDEPTRKSGTHTLLVAAHKDNQKDGQVLAFHREGGGGHSLSADISALSAMGKGTASPPRHGQMSSGDRGTRAGGVGMAQPGLRGQPQALGGMPVKRPREKITQFNDFEDDKSVEFLREHHRITTEQRTRARALIFGGITDTRTASSNNSTSVSAGETHPASTISDQPNLYLRRGATATTQAGSKTSSRRSKPSTPPRTGGVAQPDVASVGVRSVSGRRGVPQRAGVTQSTSPPPVPVRRKSVPSVVSRSLNRHAITDIDGQMGGSPSNSTGDFDDPSDDARTLRSPSTTKKPLPQGMISPRDGRPDSRGGVRITRKPNMSVDASRRVGERGSEGSVGSDESPSPTGVASNKSIPQQQQAAPQQPAQQQLRAPLPSGALSPKRRPSVSSAAHSRNAVSRVGLAKSQVSQNGVFSVTRSGRGRGRKTALIVDDQEVSAKILQLALQKTGWQCEMVPNGEEALDKVHNHHYDLILIDSGFHPDALTPMETCRRIRMFEREQGCESSPVILIAAVADTALSLYGADALIEKGAVYAEVIPDALETLQRNQNFLIIDRNHKKHQDPTQEELEAKKQLDPSGSPPPGSSPSLVSTSHVSSPSAAFPPPSSPQPQQMSLASIAAVTGSIPPLPVKGKLNGVPYNPSGASSPLPSPVSPLPSTFSSAFSSTRVASGGASSHLTPLPAGSRPPRRSLSTTSPPQPHNNLSAPSSPTGQHRDGFAYPADPLSSPSALPPPQQLHQHNLSLSLPAHSPVPPLPRSSSVSSIARTTTTAASLPPSTSNPNTPRQGSPRIGHSADSRSNLLGRLPPLGRAPSNPPNPNTTAPAPAAAASSSSSTAARKSRPPSPTNVSSSSSAAASSSPFALSSSPASPEASALLSSSPSVGSLPPPSEESRFPVSSEPRLN